MTKKLSLFLLGGFLLLLLGCRADEAYFQSSDNIAYTNRSLWQEDEMFIRIVKAVYEENKESINPTNEEVEWDYAMTMGLEDRSLVLVPVVSNNVVQYILEVRRKGEKVFFVKNYELKRRGFFQTLLFGKHIRREESKSMSSRLECVTRTISTWKPDDERYPDPETGSGRWESKTVIDCQVLDEDRCYGIVDQFGVCTNTGGGGYDLPPNWDIEGGDGLGSGDGSSNAELEELSMLENDYLSMMSEEEREIYKGLTVFQKLDYLRSAKRASEAAETHFPNSLYNGKGDAYRHALFSAKTVRTLGVDLSTKLLTAHENKANQNPLEKQMDLYNNKIGREIPFNVTNLESHVKSLVESGKLLIIFPLDHLGRPIDGVSKLHSSNK